MTEADIRRTAFRLVQAEYKRLSSEGMLYRFDVLEELRKDVFYALFKELFRKGSRDSGVRRRNERILRVVECLADKAAALVPPQPGRKGLSPLFEQMLFNAARDVDKKRPTPLRNASPLAVAVGILQCPVRAQNESLLLPSLAGFCGISSRFFASGCLFPHTHLLKPRFPRTQYLALWLLDNMTFTFAISDMDGNDPKQQLLQLFENLELLVRTQVIKSTKAQKHNQCRLIHMADSCRHSFDVFLL